MRIFSALSCLCALLLLNACQAQKSLISGPMLGHIDMRDASVWVQTSATQVTIAYGTSAQKLDKKVTYAVVDGVAQCHLIDLEPGTDYYYQLSLDNETGATYKVHTAPLWQYRTEPPAFRLAAGSCAFINETQYDRPGEPYGGDYFIFDSIASKKPDMMLWLGDNIYLREVDFQSKSGIEHRYVHTRTQPALQKLLAACPNYAIWDDHDFGPNDSNGSYVHKDWTYELFKKYWMNPSYGMPEFSGVSTAFSYSDVDFFLLDNRMHKVAPEVKGQQSTILGDEQVNWLINALATSKATYKVIAVGGQFLNTVDKFETFSTVPAERQKILDAIAANNITGVIFLTGDRHCAELSKLTLPNGIDVYDLTTSPLTSKAYDLSKEENKLRVEGTVAAQRNFATIDFQGTRKERTAVITIWSNTGSALWTQTIPTPKAVGK